MAKSQAFAQGLQEVQKDSSLHIAQNLPGGSPVFQEVLNELHPQSQNTPPRRRKISRTKRGVHSTDLKPKTEFALVQEEAEEEEEQEQEEDDIAEKEKTEKKAVPERQILHGKSHCYFVENGNVIGLADQQCQHEHRTSPSHSPSRRHASPSSTPSSRHLSPCPSPRSQRRLSPQTSTPPDSSPKLKNKFQLHRHQSSSLSVPGHLDEFRDRSQSDTALMARLSRFRKASKASADVTTSSSPKPSSPRVQSTLAVPGDRGSPSDMLASGRVRSSSVRQTSEDDLADSVSSSLRVTTPRLVVDNMADLHSRGNDSASTPKLSPRNVSSDQLHYLYKQFLQSGSAGSSGEATTPTSNVKD